MKRLLPLLLALALLLAGCGQHAAEPTGTEPQQTQQPDQTEPEQAVQTYPLEQSNYCALRAMGSRLLLVGADGTLSVLKERSGEISTCITTENPQLHENAQYLDTSAQGLAYYVPVTREVVLLNPQLQQISRTVLPEDMQGEPVIHLETQQVYYCLPGQLLALNLENGISRLVRSHSYADQQLLGSYFDTQVLLCRFITAGGAEETLYISSETGQTLHEGDGDLHMLYTGRDRYFAGRLDGNTHQLLTGSLEGTALEFHATEEQYASALPMGGVIGYTAGADTQLLYYDLESGICTAATTLTGTADPVAFLATEEIIWILTHEGQQQALCRWNVSMTPSGETESCLAERITLENPDEAGLRSCADRAAQMSEAYGLQIHLWQDVLSVSGEYDFTLEYQVDTISRMLDDLEAVLKLFPEGFLKKTLSAGDIHVSLVRAINEDGSFCQYWQGGDCYIAIGCRENVAQAFLYGVGFALDSHVLGNSRKLDNWNKLNPKGFDYTYAEEPRTDAEAYLLSDDPAFMEERAMYFPTNDRSSVWMYAMTERGADAFQTETMQAKLECLCKGIREAYGLEKSSQTYPWEQYLTESLAYTK